MATKRARVPYDDLRGYLKLLEERGMLKRITAEVDLDSELGAIAYRDLVKDGPGLWFERRRPGPRPASSSRSGPAGPNWRSRPREPRR